MKGTQNKLDGLLRVRKRAEEERQQELGRCRAALERKQEELRRLRQERQEHLECLATTNTGQLDMKAILDHRRCLNSIGRSEGMVASELKGLADELHTAKRSLEVAVRERQVVERLRQRQFETVRLDRRRRESAALDEIGQQQHRLAHEATS